MFLEEISPNNDIEQLFKLVVVKLLSFLPTNKTTYNEIMPPRNVNIYAFLVARLFAAGS